jgi:hypothetical protein
MPTECSADLFGFAPVEGRGVVAGFDGGAITSDAGALLLGATDRAIRLIDRFADCFVDRRNPLLVEHAVGPPLVRLDGLCAAHRAPPDRPQTHPVRPGHLRLHPPQAPQNRRPRPGQRPAHQVRHGLGLSLAARMGAGPHLTRRRRTLTNQTGHSRHRQISNSPTRGNHSTRPPTAKSASRLSPIPATRARSFNHTSRREISPLSYEKTGLGRRTFDASPTDREHDTSRSYEAACGHPAV